MFHVYVLHRAVASTSSCDFIKSFWRTTSGKVHGDCSRTVRILRFLSRESELSNVNSYRWSSKTPTWTAAEEMSLREALSLQYFVVFYRDYQLDLNLYALITSSWNDYCYMHTNILTGSKSTPPDDWLLWYKDLDAWLRHLIVINYYAMQCLAHI